MMGARKQRRFPLAAALPYAWLVAFFVLPFTVVFKLSLSETALAMPPYEPRLDLGKGLAGLRAFVAGLDLDTYGRLFTDRIYVDAYLSSLRFAAVSTGLLLLVGYPIAYAMAHASPRLRGILIPAVLLPFWTSFLIRIYAWIGILKPAGLLSAALGSVGLGPVEILDTDVAVYVGLVYAYLPFMVLPLYAALEKQDPALTEAAADLGASPTRAFWTVTVPMSLPGVAAGALLCSIPIVGEFVIPDLLGGSQTLMIGKTIWGEFFANRDWPSASAAAVVLLATLAVPIVLYQRQQVRSLEAPR